MGSELTPLWQYFATKAEVAASLGGIIGGEDTYAALAAVDPSVRTKGGWIVRNDETRVPADKGQLYVNTGSAYVWVIEWPYAAEDIIAEGPYTKLLTGLTDVEACLAILDLLDFADVGANPVHGFESRPIGGTNPLPTYLTTTTFTLGATANPVTYYYNGTKVIVSADKTTVLSGAAGLYFIYFDAATGNLLNSTSFPGYETTSNVFVATVWWNGSDYGLVNDERHGFRRSLLWWEWAHTTVGVRYKSGLTLTASGTGAAATFALTAGQINDEDIKFAVPASSAWPTPNACRHVYQTGSGVYSFDKTVSTVPFKRGLNDRPVMVKASDSTLAELTVTPNRYINVFIYATSDLDTPMYSVVESVSDAIFANNGYNNVSDARAAGWPNLSAIGLSAEWKPIYRLLISSSGVVQPILAVDDYRNVTSLPQVSGTGSLPANSITFAPFGIISATNVQSAIEELETKLKSFPSQIILRGNGFAIGTGIQYDFTAEYNGKITGWKLFNTERIDATDAIVIDLWKCTYAQYDSGATHPVVGDSIWGGSPPTIVAGASNQKAEASGLSIAFSAGDVFRINVTSCVNMKKVTLVPIIERT